jgi:hypothetical protein
MVSGFRVWQATREHTYSLQREIRLQNDTRQKLGLYWPIKRGAPVKAKHAWYLKGYGGTHWNRVAHCMESQYKAPYIQGGLALLRVAYGLGLLHLLHQLHVVLIASICAELH